MGMESLNCKCNCSENQGDSFIFEGVSDNYFPIRRKKNTYMKKVNNILCNTCQRDEDLEKLQEIDIINYKNVNCSLSNILENSQNLCNIRTSLNSSGNSSIIVNDIDEKIYYDLDIQIDIVIFIQSMIRGFLFRKKYKLIIRKELLYTENKLIEESIDKYTNGKIKLSEKILGKFSKDNWKKYYKEGDKLFSKESRVIIAKKYKLKSILNNV